MYLHKEEPRPKRNGNQLRRRIGSFFFFSPQLVRFQLTAARATYCCSKYQSAARIFARPSSRCPSRRIFFSFMWNNSSNGESKSPAFFCFYEGSVISSNQLELMTSSVSSEPGHAHCKLEKIKPIKQGSCMRGMFDHLKLPAVQSSRVVEIYVLLF